MDDYKCPECGCTEYDRMQISETDIVYECCKCGYDMFFELVTQEQR